MIEYYPPASPGEWVEAICAFATIITGLVLFIRPQLVLRATGPGNEMARLAVRSHPAGLLIGLGLSAVLLQQPLLYLALGISWGFSAFGQVVAMIIQKKISLALLIGLAIKAVLAAFLTLAVFGYFG